MHRRVQFGMRENPASSRRHGSRHIISGPTNQSGNQVRDGMETPSGALDLAGIGSVGIERGDTISGGHKKQREPCRNKLGGSA